MRREPIPPNATAALLGALSVALMLLVVPTDVQRLLGTWHGPAIYLLVAAPPLFGLYAVLAHERRFGRLGRAGVAGGLLAFASWALLLAAMHAGGQASHAVA